MIIWFSTKQNSVWCSNESEGSDLNLKFKKLGNLEFLKLGVYLNFGVGQEYIFIARPIGKDLIMAT